MTATLDRPHVPAAPPAADPSPIWSINPVAFRAARDGHGGAMATAAFFTPGPLAGAEAARRLLHEMLAEPLEAKIAGLDAVQRYGALLAERDSVRREMDQLAASLRRATAEREELLLRAPDGFSTRLAELDAEAADLSGRIERLNGRLTALQSPVAAARQSATRAAEALRTELASAGGHRLMTRRDELAARLAEAAAPLLNELVAVLDGLHTITTGTAGAEIVGAVDRIAASAATAG